MASNPPNPAPSFRSFIFSLLSYFTNLLSICHPWLELVDPNSLSLPPCTPSQSYSRIQSNLFYFRPNYAILIASSSLLLLLSFNPSSTFSLICIWIILLLKPPSSPLHIFERTFNRETLLALLFLLLFTVVHLAYISILMFIFAIVCLHAMFRVPEDLFYDCHPHHQDPNFIPTEQQHDDDDDDDYDVSVSVSMSLLHTIIPTSFLQNWPQLIDLNSFSFPDASSSETSYRLVKNLSYFRNNYIALALMYSVLSLVVFKPFSLLALPLLWFILYFFSPSSSSYHQPDVPVPHNKIFFSLAGIYVFVTCIVNDLWLEGYMIGGSDVCSHCMIRVPEDRREPKKVFISFREGDASDNFKSHLCENLNRKKKINTYADGSENNISEALEKVIEESMIYVIIFSPNYASSPRCLDELKKIIECKERYGRDVIPVFFKVEPSTVRHQKESYANAFVKHEERFKDKVKGWKAALKEATEVSGLDSNVIRPESTLVSTIVQDIEKKIEYLNDNQIGIHRLLVQILSMVS